MSPATQSSAVPPPVTVATLVGHRDAAMAVTCLGSLVDCCRQPLRFRVHDDGSLDASDKAQLAARLGEVEFMERGTADAEMAVRLAKYPACREMREHHILGLKLFDVPLLCGEKEIAFCDSDILFLRPFENLFAWPDDRTGCLFMQDWQEAQAIRPWHLLPGSGIRLPLRFNSGLFFLRQSRYDLAVIEELLARDYAVFQRLPQWLEQTCWGQLAMRAGGRFWNSRQICAVRFPETLTDELVAGHFTSSVRGLLPKVQGKVRLDLPPVMVSTEAMTPLSAWRLGRATLDRFLRTRYPARFGGW